MMDKNGIEIDYCPECRGVWLDRWELEKLIQAERKYNQNSSDYEDDYRNKSHDNRDHDYRNHGDDNKYKKKSWLLDLFDF